MNMTRKQALAILDACKVIETADNRAMAVDGPVPPTAENMTQREIQLCLTALYNLKDLAYQNAR